MRIPFTGLAGHIQKTEEWQQMDKALAEAQRQAQFQYEMNKYAQQTVGYGVTDAAMGLGSMLGQQQAAPSEYNTRYTAVGGGGASTATTATYPAYVSAEEHERVKAELESKVSDLDAQLDLARDEINMLKEILAEREETIEALAADNEALRDGKAIEPDADGWIEWDYMGRDRNACPVPDKRIAVWLARDRGLEKNQENWSQADYYNWGDCGPSSIIAYKVLS